MDPTIIGAIIKTAGSIASQMLQKWDFKAATDPAQKKVDKFVKSNYAKFQANLTKNCIKVLLITESGENFSVKELRKKVFPRLKFKQEKIERKYDKEFAYRLEFLTAMGILARAHREYHITRLGVSFLGEARKRKDYYEILFKS